jgi:hypothetical protein
MSSDSLILRLTECGGGGERRVQHDRVELIVRQGPQPERIAVLTIKPADGSANATITLASGGEVLLAKSPQDTLFSANTMVATPVKRF